MQGPILETSQHKILNILSDKGKKIFQQAKERAEKEDFKGTFLNYELKYSRTGTWFADENSKWFEKNCRIEKGTKGCICTWNNIYVIGQTIESKEMFVQTSSCIFIVYDIDRKKGWCYTASGSLYCIQENPKISFF